MLLQELEDLKRFIENEKAKSAHLEQETLRLTGRVSHLEEMLTVEKQRVEVKERAVEDLVRQREQMQRENEDWQCEKRQELDNSKRAIEEIRYENETLRRTIN